MIQLSEYKMISKTHTHISESSSLRMSRNNNKYQIYSPRNKQNKMRHTTNKMKRKNHKME